MTGLTCQMARTGNPVQWKPAIARMIPTVRSFWFFYQSKTQLDYLVQGSEVRLLIIPRPAEAAQCGRTMAP